jgi:hypothetical protein
VSRICPATDRKKLQTDGRCRSARLLVKGTLCPIRPLSKRAESDLDKRSARKPGIVPPVLIRLFRGVIREGAHDRLLRVLHDQVLPRLEAHPAVTSTILAFSVEGSPDEYLVESHWRGATELIRFAGDEWRVPRVEPSEEELLVSVSAHHYLMDSNGRIPARNPRPSPSVVCLDDVQIDAAGLQVMWNGSAVHLPPRGMAAMLALASDPPGPVSSAELARRICPGV